MNVILSVRAEEDLIHIYVTGAQEFGLAQADRYQDGLEHAFDLIAAYPMAARERTEIDPPIRIHVYQSHIILYFIEGDAVRILRVRHGREDWDSAL